VVINQDYTLTITMTLQCLLLTDTATATLLTGFIEASGTLSLQAVTASVEEAAAVMEKSMPDIVFAGIEPCRRLQDTRAGTGKRPVFICLAPAGDAAALPPAPVLCTGPGRPGYEQFLSTVNKAIMQLLRIHQNGRAHPSSAAGKEENWFFIKSEYRMVKVNFDDILFCEGLKDYTQVYTSKKSKPIITLQNLKTFLDRLPTSHFIRVHRSYIVSLSHIGSISKKEVEIGEKVIPIGNSYRNHLLDIVKLYS
jgi:hypothetical protein